MPRKIVIEFPDGISEEQYAGMVEAVSSVANTIASNASPAFRVLLRSDVEDRQQGGTGGRSAFRSPSPAVFAEFTVVLRGYDRTQVDKWIGNLSHSAPPYPEPRFSVVLRGYDRHEVDSLVRRVMRSS